MFKINNNWQIQKGITRSIIGKVLNSRTKDIRIRISHFSKSITTTFRHMIISKLHLIRSILEHLTVIINILELGLRVNLLLVPKSINNNNKFIKPSSLLTKPAPTKFSWTNGKPKTTQLKTKKSETSIKF